MNKYLSEIDNLLDTHAPFEKLSKKELKFLTKLWITQGLQKSIIKKTSTQCENKIMKEFLHRN